MNLHLQILKQTYKTITCSFKSKTSILNCWFSICLKHSFFGHNNSHFRSGELKWPYYWVLIDNIYFTIYKLTCLIWHTKLLVLPLISSLVLFVVECILYCSPDTCTNSKLKFSTWQCTKHWYNWSVYGKFSQGVNKKCTNLSIYMTWGNSILLCIFSGLPNCWLNWKRDNSKVNTGGSLVNHSWKS